MRRYQNTTEKPLILFAIDNSASILGGADSSILREKIPTAVKALGQGIADKYQVHYLPFGKTVQQASTALLFNEKESDFENLFQVIDNNYANQNIGALVLLSDGIYNKGANPENALPKIAFPIYCIGVGDTVHYMDLAIQKIEHNEVAYLGDNFLVEMPVSAKKIKSQNVVLNILHQNKVIQSKTIQISNDPFLTTVSFTLSAEEKGLQFYSSQITVIDGEKNTENNRRDFSIDVIDNKEKIALLSHGPHPDIAAIKESIESKSNYSLTCFNDVPLTGAVNAYALVIIHGFKSADLKLLNDCRTAGVPVWLVNPESPDNLPGIKLNVSTARYNECEVYTDEQFALFALEPALKNFIKEAPALKTYFGNYTAMNAAQVLIKQKIGQIETENPVLLFNENNGFKSAVFIGEGLWRWKMRNFADKGDHQLFNTLVSKTVQYLAVKKDKSFFRLRIPNKINENEDLNVEAELYNQSYEPVNDAEVHFKLIDAENHTYEYTMSKSKLAYGLNVGLLKPGEYRYQADAKDAKNLYTKQGTIRVNAVVLEKMNTVANFDLLRNLSVKSKGVFFKQDQMEALRDSILNNQNIKSITYSEIEENYLVDNRLLFFVVLLLLGLEWFLRKQYLLI